MYGSEQRDLIIGFDGHDRLYGDDNDDELYGGAGNDRLFGGDGDDILNGEAENDRLWGGEGADIFEFSKGDDKVVIKDFNPEEDTIRLLDYELNQRELERAIDSKGSNTTIDLGRGDVIVLAGVKLADFSIEDDIWV